MWINELGNLYLEQGGFGPNVSYRPGPVHGLKDADDTNHNYYGMKYAWGNKGGGDFNLFDDAEAKPLAFSAPMGEQEEDQMISKNHVLHLLQKHIEQCNDSTTKFNLLQIIKDL